MALWPLWAVEEGAPRLLTEAHSETLMLPGPRLTEPCLLGMDWLSVFPKSRGATPVHSRQGTPSTSAAGTSTHLLSRREEPHVRVAGVSQ